MSEKRSFELPSDPLVWITAPLRAIGFAVTALREGRKENIANRHQVYSIIGHLATDNVDLAETQLGLLHDDQ